MLSSSLLLSIFAFAHYYSMSIDRRIALHYDACADPNQPATQDASTAASTSTDARLVAARALGDGADATPSPAGGSSGPEWAGRHLLPVHCPLFSLLCSSTDNGATTSTYFVIQTALVCAQFYFLVPLLALLAVAAALSAYCVKQRRYQKVESARLHRQRMSMLAGANVGPSGAALIAAGANAGGRRADRDSCRFLNAHTPSATVLLGTASSAPTAGGGGSNTSASASGNGASTEATGSLVPGGPGVGQGSSRSAPVFYGGASLQPLHSNKAGFHTGALLPSPVATTLTRQRNTTTALQTRTNIVNAAFARRPPAGRRLDCAL